MVSWLVAQGSWWKAFDLMLAYFGCAFLWVLCCMPGLCVPRFMLLKYKESGVVCRQGGSLSGLMQHAPAQICKMDFVPSVSTKNRPEDERVMDRI
jgi:hypothetical protein